MLMSVAAAPTEPEVAKKGKTDAEAAAADAEGEEVRRSVEQRLWE